MHKTKPIKIKENGRIHDPDTRKSLSRGASDEVCWRAKGKGGPWTIHFPNGSPFVKDRFENISNRKPVCSGPPIKGLSGKAYKYDVQDSAGNIVDDPDILIFD
jgi:hypothetical protein